MFYRVSSVSLVIVAIVGCSSDSASKPITPRTVPANARSPDADAFSRTPSPSANTAQDTGVARRDSAGIELVLNRSPVAVSSSFWGVDTNTARKLVPTGTDLFRVVGGAIDRAAVILGNAGSHELLLFDTAGRYRGQKGRAGVGPGEFQHMQWLRACKSRVVTGDSRTRRFTWWNSALDPREEWSAPNAPAGRTLLVTGVMVDCSPLVELGRSHVEPPVGVFRPLRTVMIADRARQLRGDTVLTYASAAVFVMQHPAGSSVTPMPFQPNGFVVPNGKGEIVHGTGDGFEYMVIRPNGTVRQRVRLVGIPRVKLPEDSIAAYRRRRVTRSDASFKQMMAQITNAMPFPEHLPSVSQAVVDSDDNVWLQAGGLSSNAEWAIFDPSGRWLGVVPIPRRWQLQAIGPRFILATFKDQDDVEYAVLAPLQKGR